MFDLLDNFMIDRVLQPMVARAGWRGAGVDMAIWTLIGILFLIICLLLTETPTLAGLCLDFGMICIAQYRLTVMRALWQDMRPGRARIVRIAERDRRREMVDVIVVTALAVLAFSFPSGGIFLAMVGLAVAYWLAACDDTGQEGREPVLDLFDVPAHGGVA